MSAKADELIIHCAERDFDAGLAHARAEIRRNHNRLVAASLDAAVMSAVSALRVREQMRDDVRLLLSLAHRVAAGEDPVKLANENTERVLRLKQKMNFLARESDPDFQVVVAIARENFAKRLPDLARMAVVQDPRDYDDLVRRAFPERAHVDRIIDENRAFTLAIVEHIERHPHVLRLPGMLIPKVAQTAREMIEWQVDKVRRGVDEIYAAPQN